MLCFAWHQQVWTSSRIWPCIHLFFVQSALVCGIDCLDFNPSLLFQWGQFAVGLPAVTLSHYARLLNSPRPILFCLKATFSRINPMSQSALPSRDDALGPLCHVWLVDNHWIQSCEPSRRFSVPPSSLSTCLPVSSSDQSSPNDVWQLRETSLSAVPV